MAMKPARLRELYPFTSHHLDLSGTSMHYVDEGSGPPVLMLHGNPTWSFYYRKLITGLSDRYRVIAPDHVGCGLSDKPRDYDYTLATHIENVQRLVEHLGLGRLTLMVHDWGGAIGFGWAMRHVEQAERFIVFNTSAFEGPCARRIRLCRLPVFGALAVRGLNLFARGALHLGCKHRERMTPDVRRGYLHPYDSFANRIAVHRFVEDIPLSPADPSYALLRQIEASLPQFRDRPMLICWGGQDFCFNDWFLTQWIERFPAARSHRFEDAGHYVLEDAHERILPLVNRFLEKTERSGSAD